MTDKLHCPYCGCELRLCDTFPSGSPQEHYECTNEKCKHGYEVMHKSTWQDLADGKKAQDALKSAKEYYVIVRGYGKEQHYISYTTGDNWYWNWDLDHAEPFDTIQDAKDQIRTAKIPHARVMKVRRLTEITSITKQGK